MPEPATQPPHPLGLTSAEFAREYRHLKGEKPDLYSEIFREGRREFPGLSVPVAPIVRELREESSEGEVIKFVQRLDSGAGHETESVLIPMIGKLGARTHTLCLSSQVGCALGCTFCETAQMGLLRSLEPHEIVGQWFAATHTIGIRPRNLVFMGMGEPLDNYDNLIRAIAVLIDARGPAMGISKVTVSTVGRIDGLRKLAEQVHKPGWHRLGIAISINAPNDEVRSQIMPVNRRYPMRDLRAALEAFPRYGSGKFCIEYVLIPGVNDAPDHARQLAEFVRGLPCCVNLIPYTPRRDSPWPAPEESRVREFLRWLTDAGAYAKRRRTKGRDLMGACGQLGNPQVRRRRLIPLGRA